MNHLIFVFLLSTGLMMTYCGEFISSSEHPANSSQPNKDMYVIHATVYEVGIMTNITGNKTHNLNTTGSQESVTFFNTNGSHIDLSAIPKPLLTNVTAQSMVGVAPIANAGPASWGTLGQLASVPNSPSSNTEGSSSENQKDYPSESARFLKKLFRREISGSTPVQVVRGTAVIPPAVGLQSIGLPPLLSLNNNVSGIPVPIPKTAVVNYAKVNTLVRSL